MGENRTLNTLHSPQKTLTQEIWITEVLQGHPKPGYRAGCCASKIENRTLSRDGGLVRTARGRNTATASINTSSIAFMQTCSLVDDTVQCSALIFCTNPHLSGPMRRSSCKMGRRNMPATETTGRYAGAARAGPSARELGEPVSGRRSAWDHPDPSRRRSLLLLGLPGEELNHDCVSAPHGV